MPRRKPERVITHRIELGDFERSRIDTVLSGITFGQISTPMVSLLKDVSGLAALYVLINAFFPNWSHGLDLKAMRSMDSPGIFDYLEDQNLILGTIGAIGGAAFAVGTGGIGPLLAAALGFGAGQVTAELGEEAYKIATDTKPGIGRTMFMFHLYMAAFKTGLVE